MHFCFYPRHEYACPHVSHCPHLGGAALGMLVAAADLNGDYLDMLHGQVDSERQRNAELARENETLRQQLTQLKLELKLERQSKFTNGRRSAVADDGDDSANVAAEHAGAPDAHAADSALRKRGAPVGHPGWFRAIPADYDQVIDVAAPARCPHCDGALRVGDADDPRDHVQEDVVHGTYRVVCYCHVAAWCPGCRRWVEQPGDGELLGSRIGPRLRALAIFLRNDIGISYRKVPRALDELFHFHFTPAALIGFEKLVSQQAEPLSEDIAKKIGSSDGAVHADETYWWLDGRRAYFWVHATENYIHFQCDTSRAGEVSRDLLGKHFCGTLVTDCYAGYEAHVARAKQKCLAHLARTARDWQKLTSSGSAAYAFFEAVKQWVKRGCEFYHRRDELSPEAQAAEIAWLRSELERLESCPLDHDKSLTLQQRVRKHHDEWLVFLDDPAVPPTNNLAERALRPLVVLRKLTFGHRTASGARRMAQIMTVQETGKRQGRKAVDLFYRLQTWPSNRVLEYLYGSA